jgi:bidirectional [NiFe] hydrogenase diaphorase subunit
MVTIDGATLRAPKAFSVLDVALEYGICIPHLCHLPNHSDFGACRLCIVEVVKNGRSSITTSCTLEAKEGMVILSNTDRIRGLRKNVAELLVAEAPNSKAVQDMAVRCGVTSVRYPFHHNNCVLCGRCVRACNELWHANALGFVGRGPERRVDYAFGVRPASCKNCNACIDVCPMTITPCQGPMKPGQEYLCGRCESQLSMNANFVDTCVRCDLGKGFSCSRHAQ